MEILTSAGHSYSQLGRKSTDKEIGLDDAYCPLGTLGRAKMDDQALKSMLALLNKVGLRTVLWLCGQVAKTVRSILHLALVLASPWWGLRHFYYHWFGFFLVQNA